MTRQVTNLIGSMFLLATLVWLPPNAQALDGVNSITQFHALFGRVTPGDTPGFPVTISQPGSYRLESNLTVNVPNVSAIEITAVNVTLDLNGFTVKGPGGAGIQPGINGGSDVAVFNGMATKFGGSGIVVGNRSRVEKVRAIANGATGVGVGRGSIVSGSVVTDNQFAGIIAGTRSLIVGNVVAANGLGDGIHIDNSACLGNCDGATVIDNIVTGNLGWGLSDDAQFPNTGYGRNVFTNNNGGNSNVPSQQVDGRYGGPKQISPNVCGTALCPDF